MRMTSCDGMMDTSCHHQAQRDGALRAYRKVTKALSVAVLALRLVYCCCISCVAIRSADSP